MTFKVLRRMASSVALGLSLAALPLIGAAEAAWRPTGPVTIVVPYSPGGGVDAVARALGKQLQAQWGQPVVIDNAPGADGLIGTRKAMIAKPDGHTLLMQIPSLLLIPHTPGFKGVDPARELLPVSSIAEIPGVIVASGKMQGTTLSEVIQHCKGGPAPCSFGTTENMARLLSKVLGAEGGIKDLIVVRYKGGGQIVTDIVSNQVNFAITGPTAALPFVANGGMKVLATLGPQRNRMLPNVPTAKEAGMPDLLTVTWYGLFVPKGTPANIQQGIAAAAKEASKSDVVVKMADAVGAEPIGSTPAEFSAQVQRDRARLQALVNRFPLEE